MVFESLKLKKYVSKKILNHQIFQAIFYTKPTLKLGIIIYKTSISTSKIIPLFKTCFPNIKKLFIISYIRAKKQMVILYRNPGFKCSYLIFLIRIQIVIKVSTAKTINTYVRAQKLPLHTAQIFNLDNILGIYYIIF